MEQNIFVTSSLDPGSASHPFEFVLTRNQHMKDPRRPRTVTVMFREPSPRLVPEGWRILQEVVKGKELDPLHVAQYSAKVLHLWSTGMLNSQQGCRKKSPASASDPVGEGTADADWICGRRGCLRFCRGWL